MPVAEEVSAKERRRRVVHSVTKSAENAGTVPTRYEIESMVDKRLEEEFPELTAYGNGLALVLVKIARYVETQRNMPLWVIVPKDVFDNIQRMFELAGEPLRERDKVANVRLVVGELPNNEIRPGR